MANFDFLSGQSQYEMFAAAAIEAEKVFATSPAMCAIGCRKALELAVKWVFSADDRLEEPWPDNLQSYLHDTTFRFSMDDATWRDTQYVTRLGNIAVHSKKKIDPGEAMFALQDLFQFIKWVDYTYGEAYEDRTFDPNAVPEEHVALDEKKIREQESLLDEKEARIKEMEEALKELSEKYRNLREQNAAAGRTYTGQDMTEFETRKKFIDLDLKEMGWAFDNTEVREELPVKDLEGITGNNGFADYVLMGKDGLPLAVVEAKRTSKDPTVGRTQARLYADALEKMYGRRPMIFTTNGFKTNFWDDTASPERAVSRISSRDDLQKLMNRREEKKDPTALPINDQITGRYYQKEAVRAVCEHIKDGHRKSLVVMATGTGKTRTAISLVDVLSRAGYITNVLFLADRIALVEQAHDAFKDFLPDMSLCNLTKSKEDRNARIVFSTYPTMQNAIDNVKNPDGSVLFTPAHFDLIIADESHRSLYKKYKAIFQYFDAYIVGLTATPKDTVDHNTYAFFDLETGYPTYAYDYETAVNQDHYLVPYYNYEVKTKFLDKGVTYDELSEEDQQRLEDDFEEEGMETPDYIPSVDLNTFLFNEDTVNMVLQDLMERGIKIEGGDKIGKTIIFAQNKNHAEFILKCFNKLYPRYHGSFAQRVICEDSHSQSVIKAFKDPEKEPQIVVSVDMMDTGIDAPECVNLVFFKQVKSIVKFWQMIGRGTRLAPDLTCTDQIDGEYQGKRRFLIFDYCGNFEFFRQNPKGYEATAAKSLSQSIFEKKLSLAQDLQDAAFSAEKYKTWRKDLITGISAQVKAINTDLFTAKLERTYIEKYKEMNEATDITDMKRAELSAHIGPLVIDEEKDEGARRFDNFMYSLMLAQFGQTGGFEHMKNNLMGIAHSLESKGSIPQVSARMNVIKEVQTEGFWSAGDLYALETARQELRDLIKFLFDGGEAQNKVYTLIHDVVLSSTEGAGLDSDAFTFEDYGQRVNQYILQHEDTLAIYKLTHNIRLQSGDYEELKRVFQEELGSREDYEREFGDTPIGVLIRKVAKLDHEAAMEAFSQFINDESLNFKQINFVRKIINHIEVNGYIDSLTDLQKPPFDRPVSFNRMFDAKTREGLLVTIRNINENAIKVEA